MKWNKMNSKKKKKEKRIENITTKKNIKMF